MSACRVVCDQNIVRDKFNILRMGRHVNMLLCSVCFSPYIEFISVRQLD